MSSPCNKKFIFAIFAACIGSAFQHGYHIGVINLPENVFEEWILKIKIERNMGQPLDAKCCTTIYSTIVAMFSVGGIVGGLITSSFSDRCGRKKSLLWNNFLAITSVAFLIYAKTTQSYELFGFGRFLAGINVGVNAALCQTYLIEIASDGFRGAVGCFFQLFTVTGILTSQLVGLVLGTKSNWAFMFLLAIVPAVVQLACLPFCPESPKFLLITEENEVKAAEALMWLRGTPDVEDEMEAIEEEDNMVKQLRKVSLKRMFTDPVLRSPLIVCLVLNVGQQLCGINAVIYFSNGIFKDVGIRDWVASLATVGLGIVSLIVTSVVILFIDTIGRRLLLLCGFAAMAVTTIALSTTLVLADEKNSLSWFKYISVILTFLFVITFESGVGPIPWFITAELFNHAARSMAVSLSVAANWSGNFLIGQAFLSLQHAMGYYIFMVFAMLDCFFFFFTLMYLPETTRLSASEIIEIYSYLA